MLVRAFSAVSICVGLLGHCSEVDYPLAEHAGLDYILGELTVTQLGSTCACIGVLASMFRLLKSVCSSHGVGKGVGEIMVKGLVLLFDISSPEQLDRGTTEQKL